MKLINLKIIPYLLLSLFIMFGIGLLYWVVIYSSSGDGDMVEHAHSSWMVYNGKIPYLDFFQHHNPLLWYIGAPIMGYYEYSMRSLDALNILTVSLFVVMLIYIFLLHRDFLSNSLGGLVSISFCFFPNSILYNREFKPDNYMVICLVIGIYYLFKHIKEQRLSSLVISFILFFASFMFTQKAVLILFGIALILIYLIYIKKMNFYICVIASILPILMYLAYLGYLYQHNILELYLRANFELNSHIPDVFYTRRYIAPTWEMSIPIFISLYAVMFKLYSSNVYVKIIGLLFICEYVSRMYYFTPFVYYFAFLFIISSIYSGVVVAELNKKYSFIIYLFLAYFMFIGMYYKNIYSRKKVYSDIYKYGTTGFVLNRVNRCDYVLNGYKIGFNIFNKNISYIWNLQGQIDVIADKIGLYPLDNLEGLIKKYRPKIISGSTYYDTYMNYRGAIEVYPVHTISRELLNEMYTPLYRDGLYILKPELQSYDCRYNEKTKTYEYFD